MKSHFIRKFLHFGAIVPLGCLFIFGTTSCTILSPTPDQNTAQNTTSQTNALIKVGGSSSAISLMKTLSKDYSLHVPNVTINLLDPGQSENAIAGVKQKIIDIAAISKKLKPEENDGNLIFQEIAQDGILVATHSSVTGVKDLTTDQLKDIYSGKISNWKDLGGPDAAIVLLDRPEDESAKRLLRQHYLGPDLKNSPSTIVLKKEGELIKSLESTPYSIGAFSLSHAIHEKLPVNHISLDGIAPTTENIKANRYKMLRTIGLVSHQNASESTKQMLNYLNSPTTQQKIEAAGYVVMSSKS